MAERKMTQAQRASSSRSGKKSGTASAERSSGKKGGKNSQAGEQLEIKTPLGSPLPTRMIAAIVYVVLFVIFLAIAMGQEGWFLSLVKGLTHGLFGAVAFYLSVPALLFLIIIQFTCWKKPVMLRTVCALAFVFLCGCISHISVSQSDLGSGMEFVANLYQGGNTGSTGGVLCGMAAEILKATFGTVLSYVFLIVGALLCLMAAFRITIPSLIRAFQERPRFEDEEEEVVTRPDPSSVIVNTAVQKHHEHKVRRRERRLEAEAARAQQEAEAEAAREAAKKAAQAEAEAAQKAAEKKAKTADAYSNEMIRQIEDDIDTDVPQDVPDEIPEEKPATKVIPVVPEEEELDGPDLIPITSEKPVRIIPESREIRDMDEEKPEVSAAKVIPVEPVEESEPEVVPVPVVPVKAKPEVREEVKEPRRATAVTVKPVKVEPAAVSPVPEATPIIADKKVTSKEAAAAAEAVAIEIAQNTAEEKPVYQFPPLNLLRGPRGASGDGSQEMKENTRRLNETLASFKIDAHIGNVTRGPSVTRYEVELEKGVRLNKLTSAADDIALSLGASGVRIAPVPGKISVVGIEVPNQAVTTVTLKEVIDSGEFTRAKSKSSFSVGKDIGGSCIVGNISKLPHMLIAGTTGSGKSVCMNSIIISLLYKASPEDVKLIMVDPKMVELGIYNGIPHLLIPVVTDPKKAAGSLQWAVSEMMRRYKSMSDAGVRDLESYNSMIEGQELEGEKLPQVVVIIDELADLMLVAAKEVEESICRIAQMGRAAGIHLIIATQRPSADVITGLMKANIPSRIAFAVASAMESRIILDTQGAEKLVGKGDMLYAPIGCGKPVRVQGCFVSDAEVEAVATFVKENYTTKYDQKVIEEIEKSAAQTGSKGGSAAAEPAADEDEVVMDDMLPAAADVVLETGQASVSMLQRRLKLGYARAARIMDLMEELGIVGPYAGSKPRNILINKSQWEQMKQELLKTGTATIPAAEPIPVDPDDSDPFEEA